MLDGNRLSAIARTRAMQLVVVGLLAVGARAEELDLTGTWLLDESLSDNPTKVLRDASSTRGGDGIGRQIVRSVSVFGIPVGSLPLPSGGDEEEESEAEKPPENALQPISRMRILQDAQATELEYGGATTVTYRHGIREELEDRSILASWKNGALEVEQRLADGSKITEAYVLNSAAEQLEWTVRHKPKKGEAVEIRRVFYRER